MGNNIVNVELGPLMVQAGKEAVKSSREIKKPKGLGRGHFKVLKPTAYEFSSTGTYKGLFECLANVGRLTAL